MSKTDISDSQKLKLVVDHLEELCAKQNALCEQVDSLEQRVDFLFWDSTVLWKHSLKLFEAVVSIADSMEAEKKPK
jgi:hypothetical protein